MIDKYTKAVLTVIAVCLCLITAQNFNFIPSAEAAYDSIQKVAICDWRNGDCAYVIDGNVKTYEEVSSHTVQKVQICDWNGKDCATVDKYNQLHVMDYNNL